MFGLFFLSIKEPQIYIVFRGVSGEHSKKSHIEEKCLTEKRSDE
jgi:hypothetical protein